jgi:hypothetical protein
MEYHLQHNPKTIKYHDTKIKSQAGPPPVINSASLCLDTHDKVTLVARPLFTQLHKGCAVNMVYSQATHVFILEHYFTSKLFAAVIKHLAPIS